MNEFLGSVQVLCKQKITLYRNKDSNVYALAYESIGKVAYLHITFLLNYTRTIIYVWAFQPIYPSPPSLYSQNDIETFYVLPVTSSVAMSLK